MKHTSIVLSISLLLFVCTSNLYSQQVKIEGRVLSKKVNTPVANASIQIGFVGCTSDITGYFSLMVDKEVLDKNNLICSYIGYHTQSIVGKNIEGTIVIALEDIIGTLPEVIVAISAKKIVEKAMARIGTNYPDKPFILSGVLRLAFEQDNGYSYKNDAFIEIYTPSYKSSNSEDVRLIKNKVEIRTGNGFDSTQATRWATAYNAVATYDFVLNRSEFIRERSMKHFNYSLIGKTMFENHKVYEINIISNEDMIDVPYKKMKGTLFIDTASYSFVGGSFTYTDVKHLFYKKILEYSTRTSYEKDGEKWRLKNIQRQMQYDSVDNIKSTSSISFAATAFDTVNVHPFKYEEIIQNSDITQRINKIADSTEWIKYDSLFVKAEKANNIFAVPSTNIDKLNEQSKNYHVSYKQIVQDFARYIHDRYSIGFTISKLPVFITDNQTSISPVAQYSFGVIAQFQLSKTMLFQLDNYFNAGIGGIKNKQTGYYLSKAFKFNTSFRPLFFSIFGGYNKIVFTNTDKKINSTFNNFALGTTAAIEINRKLKVFTGGSYNYTINKILVEESFIQPAKFSYTSGIIYKL